MYWKEDSDVKRFVIPDDIVDVAYTIACRCLPVDHAHALMTAVRDALPWFAAELQAGIHPIHVADSGNGWMRPEQADDLLYLSRRTRLLLRLPRTRINDANALVGQTLSVADQAMQVKDAVTRTLSALTTIFSRYVVTDAAPDEQQFLEAVEAQLQQIGIRPKKMLCGIEKVIGTPEGPVHTRSLMLADLTKEESVQLQGEGLGPHRQLGCGLFIPHKDIKRIGAADNS
jgi:CRISPR-associated protein Cas6